MPSDAVVLNGAGRGMPESTGGDSPLVDALTLLLKQRRWFITTFVVVAGLLFFLGYPRRPSYTSVASFVTEAPRAGGVSDLAAQFGVNINLGQGVGPSPMFYPELIKSQQFLAAVADSSYPAPDGAAKPLVTIFGIRSPDPRMAREFAVKALAQSITVSASPQTGIVKIAVTAGEPRLAQAIARVILESAQEFNIRTRQSRAAAERVFVERRLAEVRNEQRAADNRLQVFMQENRDFSHSQALQFEHTRLEQEAMLQRQIAASLAQSYEQSKIDEVRDTPVLSVLSSPELPVLPNPRGRFRLMLIASFAGFGAAVVVLWLASQLSAGSATGRAEREELSWLTDQLRADLRRGRVLRAIFGPSASQRKLTSGIVANGNGHPAPPTDDESTGENLAVHPEELFADHRR